MKNAKNANFWLFDHKLRNVLEVKGVIIYPSPRAWEKLKWTRKSFGKKPKEGYFIWVKKQVNFPLTTCVTIASAKVSQNLNNLLVVEKGIRARANVLCHSVKHNLKGRHLAQGKLLLKKDASLGYNHFHKWGEGDFVNTDYEFVLEEGSRLTYNYQNLFPPRKLDFSTTIHSNQHSSADLKIVVNGLNSKISIKDKVFLEGKDAQGNVNLRLVGRKNSQIEAVSSIVAQAPGRGHLDCQGLLVDRKSSIRLVPELICQHPQSQITHEASIGKISEDELNYLRTRGLTESEAVSLIVNGFLKTWKRE